MEKKYYLNDTWSVVGEKYEEFKEVVLDLDSRTKLLPIRSRGEMPNDGVYTMKNFMDGCLICERNHTPVKVRVKNEEETMNVMDEMLKTSSALIRNDGKSYLLGESSYLTLTQRVKMGDSISYASKERDSFLEYLMNQMNQAWTICVRSDDITGLRKIFAVFSAKYGAISQKVAIELADKLVSGETTDLGKGISKSWKVSQTETIIEFEFPDVAFEVSSSYKKEEGYVPVVRILTSDVGYHPFTVQALLRKKGASTLLIEEMEVRHRGTIVVDDILDDAENVLFPMFTKLPSILMGLLTVSVSNPYEEIEKVAKFIGLKTVIGKKLSEQVIELLSETIDDTCEYNAYDIVSMFLDLPDRLGGLKDYRKPKFEQACMKVVGYFDVPESSEEDVEELYIM